MQKIALPIVFFLLSGCATYQAQPITQAAFVQTFESRSLDNPGVQQYISSHHNEGDHASKGTWDLSTLTLAAFYFNPDLDVARARSITTQAAIHTAEQHPNPTLQLPMGYTTNAMHGESPYTFGLGLDIPIETAGKRGYRIDQAQHLSNAARFNVGNIAWQVRSRLRQHMLYLYAAVQKASIQKQQIAIGQQVVDMINKRLSVGAASASELNQAQLTLSQNRLDLVNTQQNMLDARAQLATAIGLPVNALADTQIRFDAFGQIYPEMPTGEVRQKAILNRADVLAALSEYEASQAALQLDIARQYPDIHIGPGYTFDAGAHKFAFDVSGIALPFFNRSQGPIAEATARRTEMAARVNAMQIQAVTEVDRALQNYHQSLIHCRLAESLLAAQQRQLQALQKTFQAGETDRLGLALAQQAFFVNNLALLDALILVQQNIGQLEDAMQRPLSATNLQFTPE